MNTPQPDIDDAESLFVHELAAVYDMELRLVDALAEQSRLATNDDLEKGFAVHRTETERQVENVERAFEALGREPTRRDNVLVDGLLTERERFDDAVTAEPLRNLYYLNAAIRTERLEITSYEGLLAAARAGDLGADVTEPLEDNLEQERKTLRKLEGLAGESELAALWERLTGSR